MNELFENWADVKDALLEGLAPSKAAIVSNLLENQKDFMINETAAAGAVTAGDIAGFRKILFPMIRRIVPGTIATEIVGVQTMNGPVDQVFTLRYKYAEAAAPGAGANNPFGGGSVAAGQELWGNAHPLRQFYSSEVAAGAAAGASGIFGPGDIDGADASGHGWGAVAGKSAMDVVAGVGAAGPLYGGGGGKLEGSGGRKLTLEVISQAIEANSRKLQAGWTFEAMQDMQNQHGLNLETELTQAISAEIVQEIDGEILSDLVALAGTTASWSGALPAGPGYYQPTYIGDRFANLGILINAMANEVARKTRRGPANFMVVSPMIVSVLQGAAKSAFAPAVEGSFKGPNNTMLVGTLNGTIKVYSYLWNQTQGTDFGGTGDDLILMGYKGGNGETDAGYFYCPYVPLQSTGVVINPVTFQPVVSLSTRYGKASFTRTETSLGNSADYYAKLTVSDLSFS